MLLRLTVHFLISIVFMKNGQKNRQPILPVFQPVTIDTMLIKKTGH